MKPISNFKALSIQARLVIAAFALLGFFSAGWAMMSENVPSFGRLVLLVLLGTVTAHVKVRLSKTSTLSLLTSVVMLSLMMEGVIAALAAGVAGVTLQAFLPSRKFVWHRFVFNAAMVIVAIQAASIPYAVISQSLAISLSGNLLGILAASLTYYLGNSISVSLIVAATEYKPAFRVWYDHFATAAPSFLTSGLLSIVVLEALTRTLLAAAVLIPLFYVSYRLIQRAECTQN